MLYAQIIDKIINLIGGEEAGLPLPQEYLKANPNVLNINITNLDEKPSIGDVYEDGVFIPIKEWLAKNRLMKSKSEKEVISTESEENENEN